jgi:hypothetical protein
VRVDQSGGEIISGGSVGCANGTESRDRRGWRGSGCLRPRIPEEPAKAEDGDRGSRGDEGRAGTGHRAILVLYKAPRKPGYRLARLSVDVTGVPTG